MASSFGSDFRRFFVRGLAAILPTVVTVSLVIWLIQTIDRYLGRHLDSGTRWLVRQIWRINPDEIHIIWDKYHLDLLSFLFAIILVYIVGRFVASFLGLSVLRTLERLLLRIPLVSQIYTSIKQVTDFFMLSKDTAKRFSRVVAVQYPRIGIWSIGLVTNSALKAIQKISEDELLTVFIPSSPTPMTGYTITVSQKDVIDLDMDIDQALRFTISGGVIMPLKPKSYDKSTDS